MPVETELQLSRSITVTIGASGIGSVSLGPSRYGERWHISTMTVQSTSVTHPTARVFRGTSITGIPLDVSIRGDKDTSACDIDLRSCDSVTCEWRLADAGSVCTFSVDGSQFLVGQRAY
jgi:hypothetical protein